MSAASTTFAPTRVVVRRLTAAPHRIGLAGVLALAAFLNLYRLTQNGYANTYYAGAVRSMLKSWHNFFFASFDPGGLVSVDKPPFALWVETASAKLFGFSSFSILLPEALAGVGSVAILYLLVQRYFGRAAGLLAALALAVSPVSVAVNRDNNPDAMLVLLLVAAAYTGARAIESGRLRTLVLSAALVGLAFETKMLAAAVVIPGIALGWFAFARTSWPRRFGYAIVAIGTLIVVGGAWIAAVELTPAVDRPYVGSTTDNSALSLLLDYNGLGRVTGQTGGTSTGGGLGGAFSGTPGWLRLINNALGDQGGWLLPLAIGGGISLLVALVVARDRRRLGVFAVLGGWFAAAAVIFSFSSGIIHTYYLSALAPATAALVGAGAVALWRNARQGGAWLILPVAALALSAWLEVDLLKRSGYDSWLQSIVLIGVVPAIVILLALARPGAWDDHRRRLATAAIGVAAAALFAAPTVWSTTVFKTAVNGVFPGAGPTYLNGGGALAGGGGRAGGVGGPGGFQGPGNANRQGGFAPPAGGFGTGTRPQGLPSGAQGFGIRPAFGQGGRGNALGAPGASTGSSADITAALKYVEAHGATSRFGLIVQSEQQAASAVVAGKPVASMGGFTGRETVLTNAYLARLVRNNEARYFLLGGQLRGGPGGTANAAVSTITSTCKAVSTKTWSTTTTTTTSAASTSGSSATLYDCAGQAEAIANAS